MIKSRSLFTIFLFFVLSASPVFSLEQTSENPQIIIQGERYRGFHQYRLDRLKKRISEQLDSYRGTDFQEYFDSLYHSYLEQKIKSVKEEEISDIFDELSGIYTKPEFIETTGEMIEEMEAMLEDRKQGTDQAVSVKIDPDKVKTLVIGSD